KDVRESRYGVTYAWRVASTNALRASSRPARPAKGRAQKRRLRTPAPAAAARTPRGWRLDSVLDAALDGVLDEAVDDALAAELGAPASAPSGACSASAALTCTRAPPGDEALETALAPAPHVLASSAPSRGTPRPRSRLRSTSS